VLRDLPVLLVLLVPILRFPVPLVLLVLLVLLVPILRFPVLRGLPALLALLAQLVLRDLPEPRLQSQDLKVRKGLLALQD
jgi:hypothetical protein